MHEAKYVMHHGISTENLYEDLQWYLTLFHPGGGLYDTFDFFKITTKRLSLRR